MLSRECELITLLGVSLKAGYDSIVQAGLKLAVAQAGLEFMTFLLSILSAVTGMYHVPRSGVRMIFCLIIDNIFSRLTYKGLIRYCSDA